MPPMILPVEFESRLRFEDLAPQSGHVSNFRSPNGAVTESGTRIVFRVMGATAEAYPDWAPRLETSRTRQGTP